VNDVNHANRLAFTLLELIAVLALVAVLTTLGVSRLRGVQERDEIDQALRILREQVQRAREAAVQEQQGIRLTLDLDTHRAGLERLAWNGSASPFDDGLPAADAWFPPHRQATLRYRFSDGRTQDTGVVQLLFLPDRRCDGAGSLQISNASRAGELQIPAGNERARIARLESLSP
jgi:prepilin-type N-terminal cleavage/methylation domain-containing protein